MAKRTFPQVLVPREVLLKDLRYYFPLWEVCDLRMEQVRMTYYTASWTVRWGQRSYALQASGIRTLDLENRMLEVMRRKLDPTNRVPFVRSAE